MLLVEVHAAPVNEKTMPNFPIDLGNPTDGESAVRHLFPMFHDSAALAAAWKDFCIPLHAVAARFLGPQVRSRVDPEDIVQSAYRTLYRRAKSAAADAAGPPPPDPSSAPDDPGLLWKLLLTVTIRKAINKRIAELRAKRSAAATFSGDGPDWAGAVAAPTPAEVAEQAEAVADLKACLIRGFEYVAHQRIATLILEGLSAKEIAARIGCVERTVFRVKREMEEAAVAWLDESATEGAADGG